MKHAQFYQYSFQAATPIPVQIAANQLSFQKRGNIIQCYILKPKAMCSSINLWFQGQ